MSGGILLAGPPLSVSRAAEVLREIAPLVIGRPLDLREIERKSLPDADGRGECWTALWRDGDVELTASVGNGPGNPRDGYGYTASVQLLGSYDGKPWWRAELCGGSWEPFFTSPFRLHLLAVSPEAYDAIRARVLALLPEHRDVTLEDHHALADLVRDFDTHGHHEWVRDFLARPILPHLRWASAELCARKIALRGADPETARTWVTIEPAASRGWQALAEADGDERTSAEQARFLAALTHPFSTRTLEAAGRGFPLEGGALSGALAHVFHDPRWRFLEPADRDAFEARREAWSPSPSTRVTWTRPVRAREAHSSVDVELAKLLGFAQPAGITHGAAVTGPPLAPGGALSSTYGIGAGHSLRRAMIELAEPAPRSRALAVCHTNCEDRLTSFGLAWLGPQQQIVWRTSLAEEAGQPVRAPIELDVIDGADGTWGHEMVERLRA